MKHAVIQHLSFSGKMDLKKEDFSPPSGWSWAGDWQVEQELSRCFEKDAGRSTFVEEVFENEWRLPGGMWGPREERRWTDDSDVETPSLEEFASPEGWQWEDDWTPDLKRACDDNG